MDPGGGLIVVPLSGVCASPMELLLLDVEDDDDPEGGNFNVGLAPLSLCARFTDMSCLDVAKLSFINPCSGMARRLFVPKISGTADVASFGWNTL